MCLASPLPIMLTDDTVTVALNKHDVGWLNDALQISSVQADAEILTDVGVHFAAVVE